MKCAIFEEHSSSCVVYFRFSGTLFPVSMIDGDHAQIQEFSSGWVQVSLTKKKALTSFFFFLALNLLYRSQMVNFKEIYHFSRFQRGSNIFREGGGSNFLQGGGGVQLHITFRNPYNLRFSRGLGVRTPPPPLDPHLGTINLSVSDSR